MKKLMEGLVIESTSTDFETYYVKYGDVTNEYENLSELLVANFLGKNVRVTIEEIGERKMTQRLVDLIWELKNHGLSNQELLKLEQLLKSKLSEVERHLNI